MPSYGSHESRGDEGAGSEERLLSADVVDLEAEGDRPPALNRVGVAAMVLSAAAVFGLALTSAGSRANAAIDPLAFRTRGGEKTTAFVDTTDSMRLPTRADGTYEGMYVFKKTYSSLDPTGDGAWLVDALGFLTDINMTVRCSPGTPGFYDEVDPCAVRYGVIGDLIPEVHFYRSFVTPEGPIPMSTWVHQWNDLHTDFGESFAWHEFMSMAVTYYCPDLTPFLKRWESRQYSRLHRKYVGVLDGKEVYSVRLAIPNTGQIVEVISGHVDDKWTDLFKPYQEDECGEGNQIPYTQEAMRSTYVAQGGTSVNSSTVTGSDDGPDAAGLPLLLIVQISHPSPTRELDAMKVYLEETTGYKNEAYIEHNSTEEKCGWSDLTIAQLIASEDGGGEEAPIKMNLKVLHNPGAKKGNYSLEFFAHYVDTTLENLVGTNNGYARYLDDHVGVDISNIITLDRNARLLTRRGYSFHTGGGTTIGADGASTTDDDDLQSPVVSGSSWSQARMGMNIEFRGDYEGPDGFFNSSEIVELDYCSPTGFTIISDDISYCPKLDQRPS